MIFLGYIFSLLYGALCILVGSMLHRLCVPSKLSRKAVHILIGAEWLILDRFMGVSVHFLVVCLIFTAALIAEYKLKLLPAMSSSGDNAPGTVWYGVAMTTLAAAQLFLPALRYPFGIAVFCTSVGDGLAAVVGQNIRKYNSRLFGDKTLLGTLTVFIASFVTTLVFSHAAKFGYTPLDCLVLAALAASVELICKRGVDNIALPLSVAMGAYILAAYPPVKDYALTAALLPLIIAVVRHKRELTPWGIACASVLAVASTIAIGNLGFVLLLLYFCGAILSDKVKKTNKKAGQNHQIALQRKAHRTVIQVAANGAAAFLCAITYAVTKSPAFAIGFVTSLAQSLSDTASSGIGALSSNTYDIFRRKPCEAGVSGGMSYLGTAVSLVFPLGFACIAALFGAIPTLHIITVTASAFLGTLLDSLLGSLVQGRYLCAECGAATERRTCCGKPTKLLRGSRLITNNSVNFISNLFATLLAVLAYFLI